MGLPIGYEPFDIVITAISGYSRFHLPGVPQHVVQRANNRQACFFAEADYLDYLEAMQSVTRRYVRYVNKEYRLRGTLRQG